MSSRRLRPAGVGLRPNGSLRVVELVGTPGAGKTTLMHAVVELLQERGWSASTIIGAARAHAEETPLGRFISRRTKGRTRHLALWWLFYGLACVDAVWFLLDRPRLSYTVLRSQLRRPIRVARRLQVCFWFFQLAGRQRFLSRTAREGEVLVVDDGFLHRAVHIYASHAEQPSPRDVEQYVDLLDAPVLVVRVCADSETCEQRVRRRGVWQHSRRLTVGELARYLTASDRVVHIAAEHARDRGWRVAEIENDRTRVDEVRSDLARALDPVFSCPSDVTRLRARARS
jgi:thymidylate kinase